MSTEMEFCIALKSYKIPGHAFGQCSGNHVDSSQSQCICFDLTTNLNTHPSFLSLFLCLFISPRPQPHLFLSAKTIFTHLRFSLFFYSFLSILSLVPEKPQEIKQLDTLLAFSFLEFLGSQTEKVTQNSGESRASDLFTFSSAQLTLSFLLMEAWNFASEGKTLLFSDEVDWCDAFGSRKELIHCDNEFVPSRESVESIKFMELGFSDIIRKPFYGSQLMEASYGVVGNVSCDKLASPNCLFTPNSSLGGDDSGSKFTSPLVDSESQDSSLIALKLGGFADYKNVENVGHSKERSFLSSVGPSLLAKRARTRGSYSQTPFCQVHGCNKDLSLSKDYHKRHKVCDVHSKTAKVIVNGIEQRFCQQCSRFHLLAEFDDGKRSCRRRLAGHNERRRKPQLDSFSEKAHKLLHSYQGTRYLGTSLQKQASLVFSDILPGTFLYPEKCEEANQFGHVKGENDSMIRGQLTMPRQLLPKSCIHLHSIGKDLAYEMPSSGTEDYSFGTVSSTQKSPGASDSTGALSLLSAQSQNSSNHLTGNPSASSLVMQGYHNIGQLCDKTMRVRSMERFGLNNLWSLGINSTGVDQFEPFVQPETKTASDFQGQEDRNFHGEHFLDAKYCLSPEHGSTVDLLQLSSHLQRVERQRNFTQVKEESEEFCCFPNAL